MIKTAVERFHAWAHKPEGRPSRLSRKQRAKIVSEYVSGVKLRIIGQRNGISDQHACMIARAAGVVKRNRLTSILRENIVREYETTDEPTRVIAHRYGISEPYVTMLARAAGVPLRWPSHRRRHPADLATKAERVR